MERWQGLQTITKGYPPIPYSRKDENGKHVKPEQRAEVSARYLAEQQWGKTGEQPLPGGDRVINEDENYNIGLITLDELHEVLGGIPS